MDLKRRVVKRLWTTTLPVAEESGPFRRMEWPDSTIKNVP